MYGSGYGTLLLEMTGNADPTKQVRLKENDRLSMVPFSSCAGFRPEPNGQEHWLRVHCTDAALHAAMQLRGDVV